jgi:hypothetical protein
MAQKAAQPVYTPPAYDVEPGPEPEPSPIVAEEEPETEGEVIEEVAESDEEGDSEFSGWGIGMGEKPVGPVYGRHGRLRENARLDHIVRERRRKRRSWR